ncbi:ABC transporter ATP-binding protein [Herbiconiux ginsengi]|uniref:Amino acid/amide ABC transporter ATP-binding protein 2, HAAT family n=1 Tax=Herbiconiux ginsengi TaxID=381665 RepID=A0A1H3TGF2_9MICO|nr:ABC transporter ATP-binding protein [Herbiconiux ginsengi]SDZ48958.1 amino acid/amide ABC transporter ATP-binding protein 2, HAAT family [Herbiconiux ginsengi]
MSEILKVDSLATGYGDLRVVWDVSFSVEQGEVLALLGRNGAGKSTILRAIMGLNAVHKGSIEYDGDDLGSLPAYERVSRGLGFVQEGKRLIGDMTVDENLRLGANVKRWNRRQLAPRMEWAYDMFPVLRDRRSSLAAMLSGGQQQMLGIAQALMPEPRLLLVDEPSAGLAPAIVGDVLDTLARLQETGMSIVLVEQSVDFALSLASHVVVVDLGHLVFSSRADAPGVRAAVRDAYLGRSEVEAQ